MRGSVPEGTAGRLAIFVGATAADFEGGPGAGAATKLVVNLTLGVAITALGETLALGDTLGARPRERSQ